MHSKPRPDTTSGANPSIGQSAEPSAQGEPHISELNTTLSAPSTNQAQHLLSGASVSSQIQGTVLEKHRIWEETAQKVGRIIDGQGLHIDNEIRSTVVGLSVLGFKTFFSCEGHAERPNSRPSVDVGTVQFPYEYTLVGEEKRFRELLAAEPVPMRLRLEHPFKLGFTGSLTPELMIEFDTPSFRNGYNGIWGRSHNLAMQATSDIVNAFAYTVRREDWGKSESYTPPLTEAAQARISSNNSERQRATKLVQEFNSQRSEDPQIAVHISGNDGFPFSIEGGIYREGLEPAQGAVLLGRQQEEMKAFAAFLRDKFFIT